MQVNETNWKKLLKDVTWKLLEIFFLHLRLLLSASHFFLPSRKSFLCCFRAQHEQIRVHKKIIISCISVAFFFIHRWLNFHRTFVSFFSVALCRAINPLKIPKISFHTAIRKIPKHSFLLDFLHFILGFRKSSKFESVLIRKETISKRKKSLD